MDECAGIVIYLAVSPATCSAPSWDMSLGAVKYYVVVDEDEDGDDDEDGFSFTT